MLYVERTFQLGVCCAWNGSYLTICGLSDTPLI